MSGEFDVSGWVRRETDKAMLTQDSKHIGMIVQAFMAYTIERLSNPECEGSEEVLKAIMRKRGAK